MLGQQDFAEPSFAHDLQDIELVDQVHLFDRGKRKDSAVLTRLNEYWDVRDATTVLLYNIKQNVYFWFEAWLDFAARSIEWLG